MRQLLFLLPALALIGATVFLLNKQNTELQNSLSDSLVTVQDYLDCSKIANSLHQNDPCTKTSDKGYENTLQLFALNIFWGPFATNQSCVNFKNYLKNAQKSDLLNKNGYYENCYVNESVRQLANGNECFFKSSYAPQYLQCSGFEKYAYPPFTTFDVTN